MKTRKAAKKPGNRSIILVSVNYSPMLCRCISDVDLTVEQSSFLPAEAFYIGQLVLVRCSTKRHEIAQFQGVVTKRVTVGFQCFTTIVPVETKVVPCKVPEALLDSVAAGRALKGTR